MKNKHIEGNSPELFHEIITTMPIDPGPAHSELIFAAHGIVLSYEHEGMSETELNRKVMDELRTGRKDYSKDAQRRIPYLKECMEHNVMPFTHAQYDYEKEIAYFKLRKMEFTANRGYPPDFLATEFALQLGLKGGKAHKITVGVPYWGYPEFKNKFYQDLMEKEYKLEKGHLKVNDGIDILIGEEIGYQKTGIELRLWNATNSEHAEQIKKWFNQLAKKYGAGRPPKNQKQTIPQTKKQPPQKSNKTTPFELPPEMIESPEKASPSEQLHAMFQAHYDALRISVCDPISIPTGEDNWRFSKIFYDVAEDQEEARWQIQERIKKHSDTIKTFIKQHETLLSYIDNIEEAANTKSVQRVIDNSREYLDTFKEHIEFINQYRGNCSLTEDFLDYPSTIMDTRTKNHIMTIALNPKRNYKGAVEAAEQLEQKIHALTGNEINFSAINQVDTPYQAKDELTKGGFDISYRGRIEFVKNMLEKEGLEF